MNYGVLLQWRTERGHLRWCTSTAEKSYPTSEVRGRSQEDTMPEGQWPRGATPRPRSGAVTESARLGRSGCDGPQVWPRGVTPHLSSGAEVGRTPCPRGSGREELPHTRGQGRQLRGATPSPRSSGCAGAGGPRGATPHSRSGGVAVRRYPFSKVRNRGCTLLEQP